MSGRGLDGGDFLNIPLISAHLSRAMRWDVRVNGGGSGGFGGDIDGFGGLVRGFGGAGLGWFVVVRIGITEVGGSSGLRMPHLGWTGDGVWAVW